MNPEQNLPSDRAKVGRLIKRWEDYFLGIRAGFGEEGDLLRIAKIADGRTLSVKTIPIVALISFLLLHLILLYNAMLLYDGNTFSNINFGGMLFRIFLFDYIIFIFAALSGLDSCRRWRKGSSRIEELSLAPLMPGVVGRSMVIGALRWWLVVCIIFAFMEVLSGFPLLASITDLVTSQQIPNGLKSYYFALFIVAYITGPFVFAYFHYESAHLAHWMFSQHALPKLKLINVGIQNFIIINLIVLLLSSIGSFITAVILFLIFFFPQMIATMVGSSDFGEEGLFGSYFTWYVAAIPAALIIARMKRLVSRDFENRFLNSWLLYQWWGAGESTQPSTYPRRFRQNLPFWHLYFKAMEERNANIPREKQRFTKRYEQALKQMHRDKS